MSKINTSGRYGLWVYLTVGQVKFVNLSKTINVNIEPWNLFWFSLTATGQDWGRVYVDKVTFDFMTFSNGTPENLKKPKDF